MSLKLSQKQALGFLFDRQFLNTPSQGHLEVIRRLIVIQTQYAASLPAAFWTRTRNISLEDVNHALLQARSIVKFWAVRGTMHTVATEDLPFITQAVNQSQIAGYVNYIQKQMNWDEARVMQMYDEIYNTLKDGPLPRQAIHAAVPDAQVPGAGWGHDVKALVYAGRVVIAGDKQFAQREQWLPHLTWHLPHADQAEARQELLLRYLSGYGAATLQDFAHWSGFRMAECRTIFAQVRDQLIEAEIDGWNGTFYLRKADESAIRESETIPTINLLPKFDVTTLAYKDKTRFMEAHHYKRVYRIAAQVEATLLLKGRIAATWRQKISANKLTLTLEAFRPFTTTEQKRIQTTAESFAKFYALPDVEVVII